MARRDGLITSSASTPVDSAHLVTDSSTVSTDDVIVLTVLMPGAAREPIIFRENGAALRMALVPRQSINVLSSDWEVPGIYLLLFPATLDEVTELGRRPRVYVGKTGPGGLRSRLQTHAHQKPNWTRALIVARDTSAGFNSAQAGWLEGRVWSVARAAAQTELVNGNQPRDETLEPYERSWLEGTIEPIRQVMRLIGYPLDPADDDPVTAAGPRRHHGVTIRHLIEARLLVAGDTIEYTGRGHEGALAVLQADGSILLNDAQYSSPSAAGAAIRGGAVNGWERWARRDDSGDLVSLGEIRARLRAPMTEREPDGNVR